MLDLGLTPSEAAELRALSAKQENDFYRKLLANKDLVFSINLVRSLHEQIDLLVTKVKQQPGVHFDCKKGCSYCCTLRIEASPPEVFLIARALKKRSPSELKDLLSRLEKHSKAAQSLPMEKFCLQCPLLRDGVCSIYSIRPTMCRKYCSLDVEKCKDPESSGPEYGELFANSAVLAYGFIQAYTRAKLPCHSHELGQALFRALTDKTAEQRWYQGESVFEPVPERWNYSPLTLDEPAPFQLK